MCILWKENSKISRMNKRAEMGVGTLIIFIAFLLVAAVAAGVLIQTAGSLQQKALSTGDEAEGQISTHSIFIEVSASNGSTGNLTNFTAIIKLAPGSNPIKLSDTIFTFNTQSATGTMQYGGAFGTYAHNSTQYTAEYLQQGTNYISGNLQRGDVIKIYFEGPQVVYEDEEIRLNFIPKIGTETTTKFFTPDVISTERVYLYP